MLASDVDYISYESRHKQTDCFVYVNIFICIGSFILSISSIVIGHQYMNDQCIRSVNGFSFKYDTWLLISGISNLLYTLLAIGDLLYHLIYEIKPNWLQRYVLTILYAIFQLIWFIIGNLLYSSGVYGSCDHITIISNYSLFLVIFQGLGWIIFCAILSAQYQHQSRFSAQI